MTKQPLRRTGQDWDKISGKEISLIQAIPYTHNKFWNHGWPFFFCMAITFKKRFKTLGWGHAKYLKVLYWTAPSL